MPQTQSVFKTLPPLREAQQPQQLDRGLGAQGAAVDSSPISAVCVDLLWSAGSRGAVSQAVARARCIHASEGRAPGPQASQE